MRPRRLSIALPALLTVTVAGCATSAPPVATDALPSTTVSGSAPLFSEGERADAVVEPPSPTTSTTTTSTSTTTTASTTTTTTASTTSTTSTSTTTTLPAATPAASLDLAADSVVLGTSVNGREIVAERHGEVGGRRVLVVGVIHGNEDAGIQITDELRARSGTGIPDGVELWLVPSMNPDGQADQDRHNANEVDLNRNFPFDWGPIGEPGDTQYAGTGPASEPETRAMVAFIEALRPELALWYHQDANLVIPSTGRDGDIRARYAQLTDLPLAQCCSGGGGIYTGIAATWARNALTDSASIAFIVELPGGELTTEQVRQHTDAVLTISAEL